MNLAPEDIQKRLKLEEKIKRNDQKKEKLRSFRRDIANKVKDKKDEYKVVEEIFLPSDVNQDLSRLNPLTDPATKKLEIENNPMIKKKIPKIVFPKSKSVRNTKGLFRKESTGWGFID